VSCCPFNRDVFSAEPQWDCAELRGLLVHVRRKDCLHREKDFLCVCARQLFVEVFCNLLFHCRVICFCPTATSSHDGVNPLELSEAEKNNPNRSGRHAGKQQKQVPTQSRPPDEFTLQHFSVGSPGPFADHHSEFAYIGWESQKFPYPGKLRWKVRLPKRADFRSSKSICPAACSRNSSCVFPRPTVKTLAILEQRGTAQAVHKPQMPATPGMATANCYKPNCNRRNCS